MDMQKFSILPADVYPSTHLPYPSLSHLLNLSLVASPDTTPQLASLSRN